jgi:micrococcal nuclease
MTKTFRLFFFILFANISYSQTIYYAKVVGIKDGDTIVVIDSLFNQTTLRLAEVDCPEKSQPFGNNAKQFTSDQVYLKNIKYIVTDTDRYNRSIAMIYYDEDEKYLSAEIIKAGMGWHYKKYSSSQQLAEFEVMAKNDKKGLWIDENPIYPSEWRKNN